MATAVMRWMEDQLGCTFANPRLLIEALTHTSYANENPGAAPNQRLEFLGDAVVGMIVATYIFETFPDLPEGNLTKIRAAVVCEPTLAERSRALGVGDQLRFGKGEAVSGRDRDSILADAFEALTGAIYLDGGLEKARAFVLRELAPLVELARGGLVQVDYKTRLQEWLQERYPEGPTYQLMAEEGPAHGKRFQMAVFHQG
ncbi:MAG: ribonuclease, partial [Symbiobacteriaceae bacterium]|nr:ribonuclease [Symbiobacteriaceae bacterium]